MAVVCNFLAKMDEPRAHNNDKIAREWIKKYGINPHKNDKIIFIQCPGYTDVTNAFIIKTSPNRLDYILEQLLVTYDLRPVQRSTGRDCLEKTGVWKIDQSKIDETYSKYSESGGGMWHDVWVDRDNSIIYFEYATI